MIIHAKDLLEKLGNHSDQYMTIIIQDLESKRFTIFYINEINFEEKNIIIDIMYQKKFYTTKEVFDTISHFHEENKDSIVKLRLPEGQLIDNCQFWEVFSPVENNLSLIMAVQNLKID